MKELTLKDASFIEFCKNMKVNEETIKEFVQKHLEIQKLMESETSQEFYSWYLEHGLFYEMISKIVAGLQISYLEESQKNYESLIKATTIFNEKLEEILKGNFEIDTDSIKKVVASLKTVLESLNAYYQKLFHKTEELYTINWPNLREYSLFETTEEYKKYVEEELRKAIPQPIFQKETNTTQEKYVQEDSIKSYDNLFQPVETNDFNIDFMSEKKVDDDNIIGVKPVGIPVNTKKNLEFTEKESTITPVPAFPSTTVKVEEKQKEEPENIIHFLPVDEIMKPVIDSASEEEPSKSKIEEKPVQVPVEEASSFNNSTPEIEPIQQTISDEIIFPTEVETDRKPEDALASSLIKEPIAPIVPPKVEKEKVSINLTDRDIYEAKLTRALSDIAENLKEIQKKVLSKMQLTQSEISQYNLLADMNHYFLKSLEQIGKIKEEEIPNKNMSIREIYKYLKTKEEQLTPKNKVISLPMNVQKAKKDDEYTPKLVLPKVNNQKVLSDIESPWINEEFTIKDGAKVYNNGALTTPIIPLFVNDGTCLVSEVDFQDQNGNILRAFTNEKIEEYQSLNFQPISVSQDGYAFYDLNSIIIKKNLSRLA